MVFCNKDFFLLGLPVFDIKYHSGCAGQALMGSVESQILIYETDRMELTWRVEKLNICNGLWRGLMPPFLMMWEYEVSIYKEAVNK